MLNTLKIGIVAATAAFALGMPAQAAEHGSRAHHYGHRHATSAHGRDFDRTAGVYGRGVYGAGNHGVLTGRSAAVGGGYGYGYPGYAGGYGGEFPAGYDGAGYGYDADDGVFGHPAEGGFGNGYGGVVDYGGGSGYGHIGYGGYAGYPGYGGGFLGDGLGLDF